MAISEKDQAIIDACRDTDEPIFVLRGKDILSATTIVKYRDTFLKHGPSNPEFVDALSDRIEQFGRWQSANAHKVKYPD